MSEPIYEVVKELLKHIAASTPGIGPSLGSYFTSKGFDELKKLIESATKSQNEIRESHALIEKLLERIEKDEALKKEDPQITVIIPCGGKGGSLFPMTEVMPKCLVIINEKTILQHIIDSFLRHKHIFNQVIITAGNKYFDAIQNNVKQGGYGDFVKCQMVEDKTSVPENLLGIKDQILGNKFLLHYNDILIPDPDWDEFIELHNRKEKRLKQVGTLMCSCNYPLKVGLISGNNKRPNMIAEFIEKPEKESLGKMVNIAVALFDKGVINEYCKPDHTSFFKETISEILKHETVCYYQTGEWFHVQDWNSLFDIQNKHLFRPKFKRQIDYLFEKN